MVLRLQEKYPGCKLTVGVVTYTTPTNRPAIVARKAFTSANTIFPMFKADPHSLGIGTSGTGGVVGTAVLEGLVAGIEVRFNVAPCYRYLDLCLLCRCSTTLLKLLHESYGCATRALSSLNNTRHPCVLCSSLVAHAPNLRVARSTTIQPLWTIQRGRLFPMNFKRYTLQCSPFIPLTCV